MSSGASCLERLSGGRMFKPSGAAGYSRECIANGGNDLHEDEAARESMARVSS